MIQDLLLGQWGIWFIYQGESYEGNVHLITTIQSLADLLYLWTASPIASLSNFFLNEQNQQRAYISEEGKKRRVNSIQFFRKGIEPKWQDEQNQKGGRFIFQVPKTQNNKQGIYEQFTFYFLGENFQHSDKINGFRFISSKVNKPDSYRIQVWTNFDQSDMPSIIHFQNIFTNLFQQLNFQLREQILFKQMKGEGVKPDTSKSIEQPQQK